MRTKWLAVFAGAVTAVVVVSIAMGFASPDGSVGNKPSAGTGPSVTSSPTAASSPTSIPTPAAARDDLAPASVSEVWPGRPAAATISGDTVNWCPAVKTSGTREARQVFGEQAVEAAACAAVRFVFDKRYSRLSVPRQSYKRSSFDFVLSSLTAETANGVYRPRIDTFVANPGSLAARNALGLALLRGDGTTGDHTSAGHGRVYYGKAYTTDGYRDRAVWINPTWSEVAISVDRSLSTPRIAARLTARASLPVFNRIAERDDMLTVATTATYFLHHGGGTTWKVGGWTVTTNTLGYFPLEVN